MCPTLCSPFSSEELPSDHEIAVEKRNRLSCQSFPLQPKLELVDNQNTRLPAPPNFTLSPQSNAHPNHRRPTRPCRGVGLDDDKIAGNAVHKKVHHELNSSICRPTSSYSQSSSHSPQFQHSKNSHTGAHFIMASFPAQTRSTKSLIHIPAPHQVVRRLPPSSASHSFFMPQ